MFLVALALGLLWGTRRAAVALVALFLVLPFGAFGAVDGVSTAEAAALGIVPGMLRSQLAVERTRLLGGLVLLLLWVSLSFTVYVLLGEDVRMVDYLRDIRGPLVILAAVAVVSADRRKLPPVASPLAPIVLALGGLSDVMGAYLGSSVGLAPTGIAAAHAERTGAVRYTDAGTLTLFAFGAAMAWRRDGTTVARVVGLLVCAAIAVTSGLRIQALWVVVLAVRLVYTSASGDALRKLRAFALICSVSAVGALFFVQGAFRDSSLASRGAELTSLAELIPVLANRVVVPVLGGGWELNPANLLLGDGAHFKFYIPWFEYRLGTVWHFSVDSSLVFWLVKYGVVGLVLAGLVIGAVAASLGASALWLLPYAVLHNVLAVEGFAILCLAVAACGCLLNPRPAQWQLDTTRQTV